MSTNPRCPKCESRDSEMLRELHGYDDAMIVVLQERLCKACGWTWFEVVDSVNAR